MASPFIGGLFGFPPSPQLSLPQPIPLPQQPIGGVNPLLAAQQPPGALGHIGGLFGTSPAGTQAGLGTGLLDFGLNLMANAGTQGGAALGPALQSGFQTAYGALDAQAERELIQRQDERREALVEQDLRVREEAERRRQEEEAAIKEAVAESHGVVARIEEMVGVDDPISSQARVFAELGDFGAVSQLEQQLIQEQDLLAQTRQEQELEQFKIEQTQIAIADFERTGDTVTLASRLVGLGENSNKAIDTATDLRDALTPEGPGKPKERLSFSKAIDLARAELSGPQTDANGEIITVGGQQVEKTPTADEVIELAKQIHRSANEPGGDAILIDDQIESLVGVSLPSIDSNLEQTDINFWLEHHNLRGDNAEKFEKELRARHEVRESASPQVAPPFGSFGSPEVAPPSSPNTFGFPGVTPGQVIPNIAPTQTPEAVQEAQFEQMVQNILDPSMSRRMRDKFAAASFEEREQLIAGLTRVYNLR